MRILSSFFLQFNIVAQYSGACYKAHSNIVGWTVNCLDEYVDPSTNCTTCRGNLKEPDCNECDDHFEGSDCTLCEPNYYPRNDCSVICIPENNSDGHYKCDPFTGNRVCLEGYRDPSNGCVTPAEESGKQASCISYQSLSNLPPTMQLLVYVLHAYPTSKAPITTIV